jgi:hypothetical protein
MIKETLVALAKGPYRNQTCDSVTQEGASAGIPRRKCLYLVVSTLIPTTLFAVDFADYPSKPVKSYSAAVTVDGLVVGVEPVTDSNLQQKYFHLDFAKRGYLPVFVVLENQSSADSFILKREEIGVFVGGGEKTSGGDIASGRSKGGEKVMLASALAGSIAGALVAMHMMVKATEIRQNVIKKELRSLTLSPGESSRGFVYIPLPKGSEEVGPLRMRVRVNRVGGDEPIDLELSI